MTAEAFFLLKITPEGPLHSSVWRSLCIPSRISLADLNTVFRVLWDLTSSEDTHEFQTVFGDYGPRELFLLDPTFIPEEDHTLNDIVSRDHRCFYYTASPELEMRFHVVAESFSATGSVTQKVFCPGGEGVLAGEPELTEDSSGMVGLADFCSFSAQYDRAGSYGEFRESASSGKGFNRTAVNRALKALRLPSL